MRALMSLTDITCAVHAARITSAAFQLTSAPLPLDARPLTAPRPTNCRAPSSTTTGPSVQQHIFESLAKEMIRGSVRMIDDPAQRTGLVVKVGEQRRELCFGNRVYRSHTLRSLRSWLIDVVARHRKKQRAALPPRVRLFALGAEGEKGPPFIAAKRWHDARAVRALELKARQDFLQRVTLRSHWSSARQFRFDTE